MAEQYGAARSKLGDRCPGESDCPRFEAAGGEDIAYEEQCKACTSCVLLPTKPKGKGAQPVLVSDDLTAVVNVIEALTIEAASGYKPELHAMTPLEWEGLLEWKACEIAYRREYESQVSSLFYALVKR